MPIFLAFGKLRQEDVCDFQIRGLHSNILKQTNKKRQQQRSFVNYLYQTSINLCLFGLQKNMFTNIPIAKPLARE